MGEALRDLGRARRMGEAGAALVRERYSLDAMVLAFEALYRELLVSASLASVSR